MTTKINKLLNQLSLKGLNLINATNKDKCTIMITTKPALIYYTEFMMEQSYIIDSCYASSEEVSNIEFDIYFFNVEQMLSDTIRYHGSDNKYFNTDWDKLSEELHLMTLNYYTTPKLFRRELKNFDLPEDIVRRYLLDINLSLNDVIKELRDMLYWLNYYEIYGQTGANANSYKYALKDYPEVLESDSDLIKGINKMQSFKRDKTIAHCPHCMKKLLESDNPEYVYQCLECDEDFYSIEVTYLYKGGNSNV